MSTMWLSAGHWRGRRFIQRGRWHAVTVRDGSLCATNSNKLGAAVIHTEQDTTARIFARMPTDVPRGRFCRHCLNRLMGVAS